MLEVLHIQGYEGLGLLLALEPGLEQVRVEVLIELY
jgi:hypothetical protein